MLALAVIRKAITASANDVMYNKDTKAVVTTGGSFFQGLYVGTGGSITITDMEGNSEQIIGIADGSILPFPFRKLTAVNGAAGIKALMFTKPV